MHIPGLDVSPSLTIVIALIPLALIMLFIRWKENRDGVPAFATLSNVHKQWLLITSMPPQISAALLQACGTQLSRKLHDNLDIAPLAARLTDKVLLEFSEAMAKDWGEPDNLEAATLRSFIAEHFSAGDYREAMWLIDNCWPLEEVAAEASAEEAPVAETVSAKDSISTAEAVSEDTASEDTASEVTSSVIESSKMAAWIDNMANAEATAWENEAVAAKAAHTAACDAAKAAARVE